MLRRSWYILLIGFLAGSYFSGYRIILSKACLDKTCNENRDAAAIGPLIETSFRIRAGAETVGEGQVNHKNSKEPGIGVATDKIMVSSTSSLPATKSIDGESGEKQTRNGVANKPAEEGDQDDQCVGKEEILKILGVKKGAPGVDCKRLPRWDFVMERYGSEPVIHGLDRCEDYRNKLKGRKAKVRVAGMFNTGTNNLVKLLQLNLEKLKQRFYYEVPFGKHLPARYFGKNNNTVNEDDLTDDPFNILPVVTIRDPFLWLSAMCKKSYDVHWLRPLDRYHCPIMLPTKEDLQLEKFQTNKTARARVVLAQVRNKQQKQPEEIFPTVAHVWKSFYQEWIDFPAPRLIVRTEDLVFHGERVFAAIAKCAGLKQPSHFEYIRNAAKKHGRSSNLFQVFSQYRGNEARYGNMTMSDIDYLRQVLDPSLLHKFNYPEISEEITWDVYTPKV